MLPEQEAFACAQRCIATLNRALSREDPLPRLRFDLRGHCAGQARYADWTVRLNHALLLAHGEAFVRDTVPHEIAHLVAHAVHGPVIRPHGAEWRALMARLGAEPRVCHDYPVTPARRTASFAYRCQCRMHNLGGVRHRRAQTGQVYRCRRCGDALRLAPGDAAGSAC